MLEELFEASKRLEGTSTATWEVGEDILQLIPKENPAQDLRDFLSAGRDASDHIAVFRVAYAVIFKLSQGPKDEIAKDEDSLRSVLVEIADNISSLILPICSGASLDEDTTDYNALRQKGELGLLTLHHLTQIPLPTPLHLPPPTLLRITAFTSPSDSWSTPTSSTLARALLDSQLQHLTPAQARSFIADDILTAFLRPLFSKSRPAGVTASGRKAAYVEASRYDGGAVREAPGTKPWKYERRYAVTVFAWAVEKADTPLLQSHWPLFTPALLSLLDEPGPTALKVRALELLRKFWARCPPGLMRDTGLAEVFEQAVFPAALYLPSLTPEDESLAILGAAYPTLIEMAGLDAGQLVTTTTNTTVTTTTAAETSPSIIEGAEKEKEQKPQQEQKQVHQITEAQRRLLDKIIREGVMVGYHHAKEHVRLVGLFCEVLACLVGGMGILAVKHLKDLIPMISEIMTDPFGTKHPPTLISVTKLLQTILRTCWPRVPHYCNEIVKALMLCWLNVEDEESFSHDSPIAEEIRSRLIETANMLSAVMKAAQVDLGERVDPLIEKEPLLSQLFIRGATS